MREFFSVPRRIAIHNGIRFDGPVLERLLGIKIKVQIIDTLALSWCLFPTLQKHGLAEWGEIFGVPKPEIEDWINLSYEEYKHRCEEDVKITYLLMQQLWRILEHLYEGDGKEIYRYIDYISSKMEQAKLQEESRWKLDVEFTTKNLQALQKEMSEKTDKLKQVMPVVPQFKIRSKPKKLYKKTGELTSLGESWFDLLSEKNLPQDTEEVSVLVSYDEPNPNSTDQKKDWLYSLGWVPETFKQVKNKTTGEIKEIPQITKERQKGGGICDSIKKLYDKEPNLELLDGLSILSHRIGILSGFLRDVSHDGYLTARISGFTNTLRVKHSEIVNLPKVGLPYSEGLRGSLIAPDGYELCGADKTSLEDRIKQHFIYPYDPDYVDSMNKPGWDPHLDLALLGKKVTDEQVQAYKEGDLSIKPIRDIMKNGNYACQYGAGPPRLSVTCGIDLEGAKELHKIYWDRNWAIREVAKNCIVKEVNRLQWIYNPVSGFWYYLKYDKDRFSTLVQGTASYCFDTWISFVLEKRRQLTATFHDEGVWTVRKGYRKECTELMQEALEKTNEKLKLNRRLDIDVKFGDRYSEIH